MDINTALRNLHAADLIRCTPHAKGTNISLAFTTQPPADPGVYAVYQLDPEKPFYIGEASNLLERLKYLFRCHRNENPHPCHKRHKQAFGQMPEAWGFCDQYGVRWITTTECVGRLEIEEALQAALGTNQSEYYLNYDSAPLSAPSEERHAPVFCPHDSPKGAACLSCPVWTELSTNPAYRALAGIIIPTMGGRAKPLKFNYDPVTKQVRVWRASGKPDFKFGHAECHDLCRRYRTGLQAGDLPPVSMSGGTSYFTDPAWTHPSLGRINGPYAAAVIRHALRALPSTCPYIPAAIAHVCRNGPCC